MPVSHEKTSQVQHLRADPFHSHNIYGMIQKENTIQPRQHCSKKQVNQANQILTACSIPFPQYSPHDSKSKENTIHPRQHRIKKRLNKSNQILTACSIPFAQDLPHDSKRKGRRSIHISIAARSESIRQIKYLRTAPFRSHKIYRTIKKKEADPATSASQQDATQPGKLNTYLLLHSICTIFTA